MKYTKKSSKVKTNPFRMNMQMNIMRTILQWYSRCPHMREGILDFAGDRMDEVRQRFTDKQLEHLSEHLLSWLQWNTGKYRKRKPYEPSEVCDRVMRRVFKMSHQHCLCLVLLVAEYPAKPVR